MKKMTLIGATALLVGACTSAPKEYKLSGKIEGDIPAFVLAAGGGETLKDADTILVTPDGTFTYSRTDSKPGVGFLYVPERAFASLLIIGGTETQAHIPAGDPVNITFSGDLGEASAFYESITGILGEASAQSYPSFKELQSAFTALSDSIETAVKAVSPKELAPLVMKNVEQFASNSFIGYSEQLRASGKALDSDAGYNSYMEALDMNRGDQAMTYIHWREACVNPDGAPDYLRMLNLAEKKISDPKVLEKTAGSLITNYFYVADASIDEVYNKAISLIKDEGHSKWVTDTYNAVKKTAPGSPAIDCPLEATDGSTRNLSTLYGKVLYLDIWATWCGPCCAEIPYLAKLVEKFKGDKRIEFISISVDSNKKAWLDKVKADKPQWVQYLCGDFTKLYGITGIPCFILIDKEGKIITMNAPRPSQPDAVEIITEHLDK